MVAFLLKNWRLIGEAGLVLVALLGLWYVDHRGYARCQAETKAAQAAALIAGQDKGIQALNVEMIAAQARSNQKQAITQAIGKSNEKDDNAAPAHIIALSVNGLYHGF